MDEQGYNLKYTGKEIDDLLDKANDMDSSAQVPVGGTSGQVLTKKSGTNYDAEWKTPGSSLPSGGTSGQVLTKNSSTDGDASWKTFETPDAGETAVFEIVSDGSNHFTTTENYDDVIAAVNAGKVPMLLEKTLGYVFYLLNYASQSGGSSRWIRLFTAPTNSKKTQGVLVWNALSGKSGGSLSYSEMEYGGLPAGGSAGQALVKSSASDFAVKWATIQSGGGSSGGGLTKTQLWKASNVNMSTQARQSITLNSGLSDYIFCYIVYVEKAGSIASSTQIIQTDIALLGSYTWNLKAADWSRRTVQYSSDTSLTIGNGYTSTNALENTVCMVLGVYGVK